MSTHLGILPDQRYYNSNDDTYARKYSSPFCPIYRLTRYHR